MASWPVGGHERMSTNLALASVHWNSTFLTPRTSADRGVEIKNVKDAGAKGDNSTDDTAVIQAAIDYATSPYSSANRGVIFFPPGTYKTTSALTFESSASIRSIGFLGAPGAKIIGSFSDALLKRSVNTPLAGVLSIENLVLENTHATGKGIMAHSFTGGKILNCFITAYRCVETYGSQSISIDSCSLIRGGSNTLSGSVGIVAGNATSAICCDVSSFEHGIRHQNIGLVVSGGRYEANTAAIVIGQDETGATLQSSGFHLSGMSMEANQTAIDVIAGAGGFIGAFSSGSGVSVAYGLRLRSAQDTEVAGAVFSSSAGFTSYGVSVEGATRLSLRNVGGTTWNIANGLGSFSLDQCDTEITVAQLPSSPRPGTILPVSDATATTVGSTVAGGGANHVTVVRSNGVWRII